MCVLFDFTLHSRPYHACIGCSQTVLNVVCHKFVLFSIDTKYPRLVSNAHLMPRTVKPAFNSAWITWKPVLIKKSLRL
jgi:hypothetical protein